MPKALEEKLKRQANSMIREGKMRKLGGSSEEAKNAYVYGTLRKTGWTPNKKK